MNKIWMLEKRMPETKFQEFIFTILMVGVMVYAMICYNVARDMGGMENQIFLIALKELPIIGLIAFMLELFLIGPVVKKIAFQLVDPRKDNRFLITIIFSAVTVWLMCPTMSFVATVLYKGFDKNFIVHWFQLTALNFPMAIFWQLFFAGPLVRFVVRIVFKKNTMKVSSII